jgi:hypothetical protein
MEPKSKPIHDVDIGKIEPLEFLDHIEVGFPEIRAAHIVENSVGR